MITLPLIYNAGVLTGATLEKIASFYPGDPIRQVERASIRAFMEKQRPYLRGKVLDFGSGKQPYRDLVEGDYVPFEKGDVILTRECGTFDAVISNQVIQYVEYTSDMLSFCRDVLKPGGRLVMTGPTNWAEVESCDLMRFTQAGIRRAVEAAGFTILSLESRASIIVGNFAMSLGWGLVATTR